MAAAERIYAVIEVASGKTRLIIATSAAQARSYVAASAFRVTIPSQREVGELFKTAAVADFESAREAPAQ